MEVENTCRENFNVQNKIAPKKDTKLPDHLETCIKSIVAKQDFVTHEVISRAITPNGGNFLGQLYEITIKGQTKDGTKELNIFAKYPVTTTEEFSSFCSVKKSYESESYFYKNILKIFTQLQDDANVPKTERYRVIKAYEESSSKAILMENIVKRDFKLLDRMKLVPLRFAELAMEQLAKFHALSLVIQKKIPEYYEQSILNYSPSFKLNEEWQKFYICISNLTASQLNEEYKVKANEYGRSSTALANYRKYIEDKSGICVLCYGDYRANNIMVKEEEGKIKDIIPLDYQMLYCGNPANDIIYFIYGCTDKQFRDKHMKHLLDLYFGTMTSFFQYFDIDVNDVFPRTELDKSLKMRLDLGLFIALQGYPFYYGPESDPIDLSEEILSFKFHLAPEIIKRVEGIIDEYEINDGPAKSNHWG